MPHISNDDFDKIAKDAKGCVGVSKKLVECYNKIDKEHEDFKSLIQRSQLSTLTGLDDIEEKQFDIVKYMEALDRNLLVEPLAVLSDGGKVSNQKNEIANYVHGQMEPNAYKAKPDVAVCLNEAVCAHLSSSSHAILSSIVHFPEEAAEIEKQIGMPFERIMKVVDKCIDEIKPLDIDTL